MPLGRLLWEAGGGRSGAFGLERCRAAFAQAIDLKRDSLLASLWISASCATLAVPVALVVGHASARLRAGWSLEILSVLPVAAPAILFGIGHIVLWNRPATAAFYASGGLVVVLLLGRFLAFPILSCGRACGALGRELEEAAELCGAGPARRLASIVAPPLGSSLAGAWVLVFVLAMRELDAAILVPAANRTAMFGLFNAVHFGRDDFVAALALLIVFVTVAPGLLWSLLVGRRLELLP